MKKLPLSGQTIVFVHSFNMYFPMCWVVLLVLKTEATATQTHPLPSSSQPREGYGRGKPSVKMELQTVIDVRMENYREF